MTGAVLLPVVRITLHKDIFTRSLLRHAERSQNDTRIRLACHTCRRNCYLIKEAFDACDWMLKFDDDYSATKRADVYFATGAERISFRRVQAGIESSSHCCNDIVGR